VPRSPSAGGTAAKVRLDGTMTTVFTQVIDGEEPARFVWRDDLFVAFLSASPLRRGHTLLVPIIEVDHWVDLDPAVAQHLMSVAQSLGRAIQTAFNPRKVGLLVGGLDVPHVHIHLVPIDTVHDLDYDRQVADPSDDDLDAALDQILRALDGVPPLPN
jgi:histidine triad (HIT) family protein